MNFISNQAHIVNKEKIANSTSMVEFRVENKFTFKAGQYVTLQLPQLSHLPIRDQVRDFSISTSPDELPLFTIAYRDSESIFKKALASMGPGDQIIIDGPKGVFTLPLSETQVVFVAGGVGITPFMSMIRYLSQHKIETVPILIYYNRDRESAAYVEHLEEFNDNDIINLYNIFEPLTIDNIKSKVIKPKQSLWYVAGPPGMVVAARDVLTKLGVDDKNIKIEEFTGYE